MYLSKVGRGREQPGGVWGKDIFFYFFFKENWDGIRLGGVGVGDLLPY